MQHLQKSRSGAVTLRAGQANRLQEVPCSLLH